jgi:fumarate hydratase, class II
VFYFLGEETMTRIEKDSMGEMEVPEQALYGATTQRAVLNFPLSSRRFSPLFISSLGALKHCAARANGALSLLPKDRESVIARAAKEVFDGILNEHFVLDIFQTGSGTSTNMNANEVISNRALELIGGRRGDTSMIHPNDHVNMCQSSNDIIPSAIHVAAVRGCMTHLLPKLRILARSLEVKSREFAKVIKPGRTHLQDATPVTLGQEFSGYFTQVMKSLQRVEHALEGVKELALGGTAVGTGINTHPDFAKKAIEFLNELLQIEFREADNHFAAQGGQDALVHLSASLRTVACGLMKIANDIRWLSSGPRCGLGEIFLPATQPGSSIMPAKVNPVMCEATMMVCAQVMANDTALLIGGQHGNFELNVMLPLIGSNILESIEILGNCAEVFSTKCVDGIEPDVERCLTLAEKSLATCTSLAPLIGYDKAAALAKQALKDDATVRETAKKLGILSDDELTRVLNLESMTKPGL